MVKVTGDKKRHFLALSAACVQFMFGKASLAFSFMSFSVLLFIYACLLLTAVTVSELFILNFHPAYVVWFCEFNLCIH